MSAAAPSYPSTAGRMLARSATRLPGKLALTFAGHRCTCAELDRAEAFRGLKRELRDQLSAPAAASP